MPKRVGSRYRLPTHWCKGGPFPNYRRIGKIERSQPIMEEAIFSPDGKFMWTGSEWIPAPPEAMDLSDTDEATRSQIETLSHDRIPINYPTYVQQAEFSYLVAGAIILIIVWFIFDNYQFNVRGNILFGSCGLYGLMSVAAGIKGKTVAAHPKEAVLFELQNGHVSYAELEKKIGIDSKELRKILTELDREGVINVNKIDS